MPVISSDDAAKILGISSQTIRRLIARDIVPARREGIRGLIRIEIDDLRNVAEKYQYRFDEGLAAQLGKN